jgi:hypothetical protein
MRDEVKHFRALAEDAKQKAKTAMDPERKRQLRNLADGWSHLAEQFEADIERLNRKE